MPSEDHVWFLSEWRWIGITYMSFFGPLSFSIPFSGPCVLFFFAPALDVISWHSCFFITQLASVQKFSAVSSFEPLKVDIATGLSRRRQIIYLSYYQPICVENFPSTTPRMQPHIGEMEVQPFIFSMPRRLAFYNLYYLHLRSALLSFPVHLGVFPVSFGPHCWVGTNFCTPWAALFVEFPSNMQIADILWVVDVFAAVQVNHQVVCRFLQRAASPQLTDRSPAVHWTLHGHWVMFSFLLSFKLPL